MNAGAIFIAAAAPRDMAARTRFQRLRLSKNARKMLIRAAATKIVLPRSIVLTKIHDGTREATVNTLERQENPADFAKTVRQKTKRREEKTWP